MEVAAIEAVGWQIPWAHRRRLGWWRAYWRTVNRVTWRGKRLFRDLPQYVDYHEAQRFRWITLAIFAFTALVVWGCYAIAEPERMLTWGPDTWLELLAVATGLLALIALTGLPSYLCHPRRLPVAEQNRAIALSYYACAPLAWVSVALVLYLLMLALSLARGTSDFRGPPWTLIVFTAFFLILWWFRLVQLGRWVMPTWWLRWRMALLVPVLWVFVGGLIAVGLRFFIFYIVALIYSVNS